MAYYYFWGPTSKSIVITSWLYHNLNIKLKICCSSLYESVVILITIMNIINFIITNFNEIPRLSC